MNYKHYVPHLYIYLCNDNDPWLFNNFYLQQTILKNNLANILLRLAISVFLLLMITFYSFQNQLYFLRILINKYKSFSFNPFHNIKYACFLYDQIPKLLDMEYLQGRCSPIFAVEDFSRLFVHHSIFLSKDSISAYIICSILSDFIYWLSSNILSFSDGMEIPQKSLFLHDFHQI